MMEEAKYYTPDISEFHVGFEYEEYGHNGSSTKEWFPTVLTQEELQWSRDGNDGPFDKEPSKYRVKHLDRTGIESLGWKYSHTFSNPEPSRYKEDWYRLDITVGYYQLSITFEGIVTISSWLNDLPNATTTRTRFLGTIRNKSELSHIMKMIGI